MNLNAEEVGILMEARSIRHDDKRSVSEVTAGGDGTWLVTFKGVDGGADSSVIISAKTGRPVNHEEKHGKDKKDKKDKAERSELSLEQATVLAKAKLIRRGKKDHSIGNVSEGKKAGKFKAEVLNANGEVVKTIKIRGNRRHR